MCAKSKEDKEAKKAAAAAAKAEKAAAKAKGKAKPKKKQNAGARPKAIRSARLSNWAPNSELAFTSRAAKPSSLSKRALSMTK